jgi:hypothetical protein
MGAPMTRRDDHDVTIVFPEGPPVVTPEAALACGFNPIAGQRGKAKSVAADELACKPGCFRSDWLTSHFP